MNSYYFTEEHEMFRQSLRAFLEKEVQPHIEEWEENRFTPRDIWKKMGDMGFLGLGYPEEYGDPISTSSMTSYLMKSSAE